MGHVSAHDALATRTPASPVFCGFVVLRCIGSYVLAMKQGYGDVLPRVQWAVQLGGSDDEHLADSSGCVRVEDTSGTGLVVTVRTYL